MDSAQPTVDAARGKLQYFKALRLGEAMEFVHQPAETNRLGEVLLKNFTSDWTSFRAAVAFVKRSGVKHISSALKEFAKSRPVQFIVGINHRVTSKEGLEDLLNGVAPNGQIIVCHNPLAFTFHPKLFLFQSNSRAELIVGSGNLTEGGLFTNYEAGLRLKLDLSDKAQSSFVKSVEAVLDDWADPSKGSAKLLNSDLLSKLVARGVVPPEALASKEGAELKSTGESDGEAESEEPELFSGHKVPRAPKVAGAAKSLAAVSTIASGGAPATGPVAAASAAPIPTASGNIGFVMTLQNTDVSMGQKTKGTSARSPEIFIPLKARDEDPEFWGFPNLFTDNGTKWDRSGVTMRFGRHNIKVNVMGWKLKRDFRLRNKDLRGAGNIGDILRVEKAPPGAGYDYYAEVIPPGNSQYATYLGRCTEPVTNSKKLFGYY